MTTVFTVQPSLHHRHSTNRVSWSVTIVGERRGEVWQHVRRRWSRFMILGLSSADGGVTVGLWKLSSLDGRRPPWYRPQIIYKTLHTSSLRSDVAVKIKPTSSWSKRLKRESQHNESLSRVVSRVLCVLVTAAECKGRDNGKLCLLPRLVHDSLPCFTLSPNHAWFGGNIPHLF